MSGQISDEAFMERHERIKEAHRIEVRLERESIAAERAKLSAERLKIAAERAALANENDRLKKTYGKQLRREKLERDLADAVDATIKLRDELEGMDS